jgi:hypothetical protein
MGLLSVRKLIDLGVNATSTTTGDAARR